MSVPVYFWYPTLCMLSLGFMFMNIPPVSEQFMGLFGVQYGGLSFFLSSIYWTHSIVQIPAGIFIDRLGALRSLLLCIAICLAFNLLPLYAPESIALAAFSRFFLGIGTGALFLVGVKIGRVLTPPNYIARVQAAQGAAFCLGTMLPYLSLPYLGPYGWAGSYLLSAAFCAALLLGVLWLPRERLGKTSPDGSFARVWGSVRGIATSRAIWILGCCHGFAYGTLNTIGNWIPSILVEARPGTMVRDWAVAASVMLLLGTAGRASGGEIPRMTPRGPFIGKAVFAIGALYLGMAFSHNPIALIACAFALALVCGGTYASITTLTMDIAGPAYVATAMGCMNMVANFVSVALTVLLGNARDMTGSFFAGLATAGCAALLFWLGTRRFLRGMGKQ